MCEQRMRSLIRTFAISTFSRQWCFFLLIVEQSKKANFKKCWFCTYVSCWVAQARRGICTRSVRLIFLLTYVFLKFKRIPNYVITSMRRFRVGDMRTPWKMTKYRVSISNTGFPETSQIYQVSIRWLPASMVNGLARMQERWKGDARQMETTISSSDSLQFKSSSLGYGKWGELPWVLLFLLRKCLNCVIGATPMTVFWSSPVINLKTLSELDSLLQNLRIREWPVRFVT